MADWVFETQVVLIEKWLQRGKVTSVSVAEKLFNKVQCVQTMENLEDVERGEAARM